MTAVAAGARWLVIGGAYAAMIAVAQRAAWKFGAVARPNPIVKSHRAPVAYLGGAALILTWAMALALTWVADGITPSRAALVRVAGALTLTVFGTWDDLRAFGPGPKFLLQLGVCVADVIVAGPASPLVAAVHVLILVSLVNAFNLIDVMDGLLCLVAAIAAGGLLWTPGLITAAVRPEIAILLAGLAVLFLFNRPPARIYCGDAGSMTLGFLVGTWILQAATPDTPLDALALVGLCAAPALELMLLIPARLRRGLSPFRGSPDHYSLRLQDQLGWSKLRVLLVTAVAGASFALAPAIADRLAGMAAAALAAVSITLGLALWLGLWRIPPRRATAVQARTGAGSAP